MTANRPSRLEPGAAGAPRYVSAERMAGRRGLGQTELGKVGASEQFLASLAVGADPGASLVQALKLVAGGAVNEVMTKPYAQNAWAYACMNVRARALASVPLKFWKGDAESSEQAGPEDPIVKLFKRPAPALAKTYRKFMRAISIGRDLSGGVFLFLAEKGGAPVRRSSAGLPVPGEMWVVRDDLAEPVFGTGKGEDSTLPKAWRINVQGGKTVEWPDEATARLYDPDPYDQFRALGPMEAAWRAANRDFRVEAYDDGLLENAGEPGGLLTRKDGSLTKEQAKELEESWKTRRQGPKSHRKVAALPFGVEYSSLGFTPKDMEFSSLRKWDRDTILAVFGVTPTVLGITEDINRANAHESRRVFYETTVLALLLELEDEIQNELLMRLVKPYNTYTCSFDLSAVKGLREDLGNLIERTLKLFSGGGRSFHEAAALVGWDIDRVKGGDDRFLPTSLMPADMMGEEPDPPPGDDKEREDGDDDKDPPAKEEKPEKEEQAAARPPLDVRPTETAAARRRRSERWDAWLRKHDQKIARAVQRVLVDYILATRKKLRAVALEGKKQDAAFTAAGEGAVPTPPTPAELDYILVTNLEAFQAELARSLGGPYESVYEEALGLAAEKVGTGTFIKAADPLAMAFLRRKALRLAEGSVSTLAEQVRATVMRTIADGGSVGTIQSRVYQTLSELEEQVGAMRDRLGTRASFIARTEAGSVANHAQADHFKAAGVEQVSWLSSGDDLVRKVPHDHSIDGQLAPLGQTFSNGLRWPGDERGSAANVINCRCTIDHVPKPDDKKD